MESSGGTAGSRNWTAWAAARVRIYKSVSVEPVALLMMTSVLMAYIIFQNMLLENICIVSRGNSKEFCRDLVNAKNTSQEVKDEEKEIQKIMANTKILRSALDHTFPVLYLLFVGPWSDHFGRKIVLLLSVLGYFVQSLIYTLMGLFYESINPYFMSTLVTIPRFLTGGEVAYSMAAYSYISDTTTTSTRTIRIGLLNGAFQFGVPLGFMAGGFLSTSGLSYSSCFSIASGVAGLGLVLLYFLMNNQVQADNNKIQEVGQDSTPEETAEDIEGPGIEETGEKIGWRDAINPMNSIYQVVKLPFVKRAENKRITLIFLLLTFICTAAPIHGEFGVTYMFVRERLTWNGKDYAIFSAFNTGIGALGVILSMGILSNWLKLSDPLVGFIAGMSQMIGSLMYALAYSGLVMYLASTVDMMNGTMIVVARSMMSKVVEASEIGKLFSLIGVLETLTPLAMDPFYSLLYRLTVDFFSGTYHFVSAGLTLLPQAVFLWLCLRNCRFCTRKRRDSNVQASATSLSTKQSVDSKAVPNLGKDNPTFNLDYDGFVEG